MEKPQVFIVDASVAVKWYVRETMHDKALRIRDDFVSERIELEAPSLLLYEVGNALRHHPASTPGDCAEAVRQLRNLGLRLRDLDDTTLDTAAELAFKERLTFYDAVYLALAKTQQAMLVTADQKFSDQLSPENRPFIMHLKDYS